jgi:hypothetical protein
MQCKNNLKQLALAAHSYEVTYNHFPTGTMANAYLPPEKRLSWLVLLLPHLECDNIYSRLDKQSAWDGALNMETVTTPYSTFLCPTALPEDQTSWPTITCYVGISGIGSDSVDLPTNSPRAGVFGYDRLVAKQDITDGLSNTLFALETSFDLGPWAAGGQSSLRWIDWHEQPYVGENRPFGRRHKKDYYFGTPPTQANAAFSDGSVRELKNSIHPRVFEALATIAGGEEVPEEY